MKVSHLLIRENNNLDLIRIFLAIIVIVGHTEALNGEDKSWADPLFLFDFTYSGALAVKLFFFISGLVVTNSYLNKKDPIYFVIARAFRILPLLFFVLAVTVFIFGPVLTNLTAGNYFSNPDNFAYIWKNLLFNTQHYLTGVFNNNHFKNEVNGSLWTLKYEMACYLIVLLAFGVLGKKNKYFLNIPILLVIIDAFLTKGFFYHYLGENTELNLTPVCFALGALLAINSEIISINLKTIIFTLILYFVFSGTAQNHLLFILCVTMITIYISANRKFISLKPKYDISYGVYLWGFLIQQTLYHYFGHMASWLHCLLAVLIACILGLGSHLLIEKPFMILGKKMYQYYKTTRHSF